MTNCTRLIRNSWYKWIWVSLNSHFSRFDCFSTLPELFKRNTCKMLPPIIAGTLFSRPYKVQTKTEISSFRAKDYSCPCIGYTFSRAFFMIHVFPRLVHVPRFPALSSRYMFSCAFCLRSLVLAVCLSLMMISRSNAGYTISRAWYRLHNSPRLPQYMYYLKNLRLGDLL